MPPDPLGVAYGYYNGIQFIVPVHQGYETGRIWMVGSDGKRLVASVLLVTVHGFPADSEANCGWLSISVICVNDLDVAYQQSGASLCNQGNSYQVFDSLL